MEQKYFIIDFDSTFIQTEGLEELFKISLKNSPDKEFVLKKIQEITNLGMEGKLDYRESLKKRLQLLVASSKDLEFLAKMLKRKISPSVLRNKKFFKKFKDQIFVVTGGFEEFVFPVLEDFGIEKSHIIGNRFEFDKNGQISGFDTSRPTSKDGGKIEAIKKLNLKGEIIVIGDGFTDYQVRQMGIAKKFVAFTENVFREAVVKKADMVVSNFDEFLFYNKLPTSLSYPKSKIKVLLLENIEKSAADAFKKEGYLVETLKTALDEQELSEKIKDVSILGIRSKTLISKKVLENAKKLIGVGAFSIGTDQMDIDSLTNRGIVIFNAPFQNTRSVVELALGEMIMLLRGVIEKNNKLHKGIWDKSAVGSNEIRGKVLGIVGYGSIGSQLSVLAENLGMKVYFYDTLEKLPMGNAVKVASLNELFKVSDVISIHVSGDRINSNLIGEKEFAQMKDGVVFLNLSRGFVVDNSSLAKFIKIGKIRGVGVDVFPSEPKGKDDPFLSELQNLPNAIITPHIAGSTEEAQKNIANFVSSKIIDFLNTGNTYLSVNLPQIILPVQKNVHRLLHLHKNMPGVLARINQILAENKINLEGQYLKTDEEIGYVITDVNKKYDQKVLKELKKIPDTIRFRILY